MIEHFFKKTEQPEDNNKDLNILIGDSVFEKVISWKFVNSSGIPNRFNVKTTMADKRVQAAINGAADVCFLPSTAFPRLKGGWKVVKDIGFKIKKPLNIMNLFFREGLSSFEKISASSQDYTEIDLLKIIMKEKYVIDCNIDLNTKGKNNDAVLLSGQASFDRSKNDKHYFNLMEEWLDLTSGKPLVTGFWIISDMCRQHEYIASQLRSSIDEGLQNLENIFSEVSFINKENFGAYIDFQMDEEAYDSLDDLYRLLFYHGITEYIPEFNFI